MLRRILIVGTMAQSIIQPAYAVGVRELGQDELRQQVSAGQSLSLDKILAAVAKNVEGEVVDVRAFDLSGICYRVLIMLPTGKLASVVVDAATGGFLASNSSRAKQVREAARASDGNNGNGNNGNSGNKGNSGKGGGNNGKGNGKGGGNNGNGKGNGGSKGKK